LSAQYTNSNNGPPYQHEQGQLYLMDLYRHVHGRMHSPSRPLKMMCHTAEKEILFGLVNHFNRKLHIVFRFYFKYLIHLQVTPSYELYMVVEPMTTKAAIMNAANSILKVFELIHCTECTFKDQLLCSFLVD
jgi:hypothetical protein